MNPCPAPQQVRTPSRAIPRTRDAVIDDAWRCSERILDMLDEFSERLGEYSATTGDVDAASHLGTWTHTIRAAIDNEQLDHSLATTSRELTWDDREPMR